MESQKPTGISDRRIDYLCLLFLLAVNTFYYRRILFLGEIPGGNDLQYQYFAWKNFFINSLKEGVFPFWNPYSFAGTPFVHEILAACFYPFDYLFLILPLPWGFGVSYWFHLTLGGFLFYWLSGDFLVSKPARLMTSLMYMLSGPVLARMGEGVPTMNQTYALTPLFFMVGKRLFENPSLRLAGCFAWVCAIFIYAGHPQIPFMAVQLLSVYLLYRVAIEVRAGKGWGAIARPLLFVVASGILGLAIAAPQAFPFLEYASFSATRSGGAQYSFASEGSLPPLHTITSILPFFFGDPSDRSYWALQVSYHETCAYLGAFGFFFSICWLPLSKKKGTWFWFAVSVVALLIAFGKFTPIHWLLYEGVPGWDRFRQPARAFFILALSGSLLAGFGFEGVIRLANDPNRSRIGVLFACLALVLIAVTAGFAYTVLHRQELLEGFNESMNRMMREGTGLDREFYIPEQFVHRYTGILTSLARFSAWVFVFGGWLLGFLKFEPHRRWLIWAAPTLVALDLLVFGSGFLPTHDRESWRETYYPESPAMEILSERADKGRLVVPDNALHWSHRHKEPELYPNGPLYYRIRAVRGYNPTILAHYSEFINRIQGKDSGQFPGGLLFLDNIPGADPTGLRVLGIQSLVEWNPVGPPFVPEQKFPNGLLLYRFEEGLPRAFRAVDSDNDWGLEPMERDKDRTEVLESDANRILVETESEESSWLVFNDCWFPGWKASIDGEPAEIARAFHAFQAVKVPAGKSVVEWRFRPTLWNLYVGVALVAGMLSTLLLLLRPRERLAD